MAKKPAALLSQSPRTGTTVRGFYNVATATALPDVTPQRDLGTGNATGGKGLMYGPGNTVPQIALDAALNSGTAYRCLERRTAFLVGMGLPPAFAERPVPGHPGKTYDELWGEECSDFAYFNGVAFLVRWSMESPTTGIPGEVHLLPFPSVRKTDKGTYLLNHKFGRKGYKANENTEHFPFDNSPEAIQAVLDRAEEPVNPDQPEGAKHGQPGQILYAYIAKAGEKDYPLPPHWAGLEDVLLDTELSKFDLEEVRNGFFPNGVLTLIGEQDDQTEDEDGLTQSERTNEALRDFTGNGTNQTGRDKLLVLEAKTKEQAPILTPFNGTTNMEKLDAKKESTGMVVCRHIGIPPILAGFAKAGQLGAAQEILNAVELTQDDLAPLQSKALRTLALLLPELKGAKVGAKKPISFLPPEVLAVLTVDEKRKLGGYDALPAEAPTPANPAA
jgi:hypothetical protein